MYITGNEDVGSLKWDGSSSPLESTEDVNSSSSDEKKSSSPPPSILSEPRFKLIQGRPDFAKILKEEADSISGRLSVSGEFLLCTIQSNKPNISTQSVALHPLPLQSVQHYPSRFLGRRASWEARPTSPYTSNHSATLKLSGSWPTFFLVIRGVRL